MRAAGARYQWNVGRIRPACSALVGLLTAAIGYAGRAITLGGLSGRQLVTEVWRRTLKDDVAGRSAQLSYYFTLAFFPLLIFLSTVFGYVFAAERHLPLRLLSRLGRVMPAPAFELVRGTVEEITQSPGSGKLTIGLVLTLWTASSGMEAIIEGLNVSYQVPEVRPYWKRRLVAIGLTVSLGALVAAAVYLIVVSGAITRNLTGSIPIIGSLGRLSDVLQWSIGLGCLLLALALIFRLAPNLRQPRWEANLPGAVLALTGWLLASAGLRLYFEAFDLFSRTYGSLGAVIVLLIWLYVSGAAILIGGGLNAVIWQAVRGKASQKEMDGNH